MIKLLTATVHAFLAFSIALGSAPWALDAQPVEIPPGIIDQNDTVLAVKPSATDHAITASDFAHVVIYDREAKPGNIRRHVADQRCAHGKGR